MESTPVHYLSASILVERKRRSYHNTLEAITEDPKMKRLLLALMLLYSTLYAKSIDDATFAQVMLIADREGVPRSVAARLMFEESGDPKTGSRGDPLAEGDEKTGWKSKGLYQIHTRPANLEELVRKDWPYKREEFDIFDPLDNATLAMRYLSRKHRDLGTWYRAVCYYNSGEVDSRKIPTRTKRYARRIIEAREP